MISPESYSRALSPLALAGLFFLTGCGGQKAATAPPPPPPNHENAPFPNLSTEASEGFGAKKAPTPGQPDSAWSIPIISAVGESMDRDAQLPLEHVRSHGHLPQAY